MRWRYLLLLVLLNCHLGWSQIADIYIGYSITKDGPALKLECQPVNAVGGSGVQSGVAYFWQFISAKDTAYIKGSMVQYYISDTSLRNLEICMKAVEIVNLTDSLTVCKKISISNYLWMIRGLEIPHIFYEDKNQNCQQDNGEDVLNLLAKYVGKHGSFFNYSQENDTFKTILEKDKYQVKIQAASGKVRNCKTALIISDSSYRDSLQRVPVILSGTGIDNDIYIVRTDGWNPGYAGSIQISVRNNGIKLSTLYVKLSKPSKLTYLGSDKTPLSQNATNIVWKVYLNPNGQANIRADFHIASSYNNTDSVILYGLCDSLYLDMDTNDNRMALVVPLDGSYDPNDKAVLAPYGLAPGNPLEYKVRFQNTGDAAARRVVVVDTLSEDLDPETLHVLNSSHTMDVVIKNRIAQFIFDPIYLPDSNSDAALSQGFLRFQIQVKDKKMGPLYDTIHNRASIYFDFNEPILTNAASIFAPLFVSTQFPANKKVNFHIYPNPGYNQIHIHRASDIENETIQVYTLTGESVLSFEFLAGQKSMSLKLPGNLMQGTYIIKSSTGSSQPWLFVHP